MLDGNKLYLEFFVYSSDLFELNNFLNKVLSFSPLDLNLVKIKNNRSDYSKKILVDKDFYYNSEIFRKYFIDTQYVNIIQIEKKLDIGKRSLFIFDFDSTLINEEIIEVMGEIVGEHNAIKSYTENAMNGEIDFTKSLFERLKILSDFKKSDIKEVINKVSFKEGVKQLVNDIKEVNGYCGIVSGGFLDIIKPLVKDFDFDFLVANELCFENNNLSGLKNSVIVDGIEKEKTLIAYSKKYSISRGNRIAIGDGANDIMMIKEADIGIALNAKKRLKDYADYIIDFEKIDIISEMLIKS